MWQVTYDTWHMVCDMWHVVGGEPISPLYTRIPMNSEVPKCTYYDKGLSKNKGHCINKHSTTNCNSECHDKKTCPFRHRVMCKNRYTCSFLSFKSCEFLHEENLPENKEGVNNNDLSIEEIKASVKYIDEKVVSLDTAISQKENMVSQMETCIYKYSQMEKKSRNIRKGKFNI